MTFQVSGFEFNYIVKEMPHLIDSKEYRELSLTGKKLAMKELLKDARAEARRVLTVKDPHLALKIQVKSQDKDLVEFLKERGAIK